MYFLRLSNGCNRAVEFTLSADFDALELATKMGRAFADYKTRGGGTEYLQLHIGRPSRFYPGETESWFNSGYSEGRFTGYRPDFIKNEITVFEKLTETIVRSYNALGRVDDFLVGIGDIPI